MYDAVFVLVEAFNKFLRKKPDRSNVRRTGIPGSSQITNGTRALDCNSSRGWVTPFEYGDKISRLLRKVSETHLSFFLRERLKKRKKKKMLKNRCGFISAILISIKSIDAKFKYCFIRINSWKDKFHFINHFQSLQID